MLSTQSISEINEFHLFFFFRILYLREALLCKCHISIEPYKIQGRGRGPSDSGHDRGRSAIEERFRKSRLRN